MYHTHKCVSSMCLLDVMVIVGDRMLPEVLAMVARCSGELHLAITPLLKIRMQDVTEMRQLVFRLYPTIFDHQENQTLKFYLQLISHVTAPILDFHALRPYIVCILDGRVNQDAIKFVFSVSHPLYLYASASDDDSGQDNDDNRACACHRADDEDAAILYRAHPGLRGTGSGAAAVPACPSDAARAGARCSARETGGVGRSAAPRNRAR